MAKGKTVFRVKVRIKGVAGMRRTFRSLPPEANKSLRRQTLALSKELAAKIAAAATADGSQSAAVAGTVKAVPDRVPVITAGGPTGVGPRRKKSPPSWGGRRRVPAGKLLFGANFGATHLNQYRPHRPAGGDDYWFYKTIEDNEGEVSDAWNKVVDDVAAHWASVKELGDG